MDLINFCRAHGILIDAMPPIGVWRRYPTEDHPRSKNGAVKYMGTHAFVQNHAIDQAVNIWKPESVAEVDRRKFEVLAKRESDKQIQDQKLAREKAAFIVKSSQLAFHEYLKAKGFPEETGYVWTSPDGNVLVIPMRIDGQLFGCQLIDKHGSKKFLYGQKSSGAEFIFDNKGEHFFCEGFATALSIKQSLKAVKVRYTIHVCFSANNLLKLTQKYKRGFVIADNDESLTGENVAKRSGLPYWMSPVLGEDGNDFHQRMGLFKLSQEIVRLLQSNKAQSIA
jgi:putative DNA primase/helicase